MKYTALIAAVSLLAGCANHQDFRRASASYTDFRIGDIYVLQSDVYLLEYNYKLIPLIKPGRQLVTNDYIRESELALEFKVTGHAKKGDRIRISHFEPDGGWIPGKGDYFMPNPVGLCLDGELKGKKIGLSMLCTRVPAQISYKTGIMYFATPDTTVIKKADER